jgi:hypothetical protein
MSVEIRELAPGRTAGFTVHQELERFAVVRKAL